MASESSTPIASTVQPGSPVEGFPLGSDPSPTATAITRRFEIYGASSRADLDSLKCLGFNQVILDFFDLAEPAECCGFSVVLARFWDKRTTWSDVYPVLELAQNLTRLVSINMMDEPIYNGLADHGPEVYLELRRQIRAAGYDEPLSLTMYGPQETWPTAWSRLFLDYLGAIDILRIDPYPIAAGKPLRVVYDWIQLARQLMAAAHRDLPLTVVLQAWDSGGGLPTIDQIRVMAYMALCSGADTLSFFKYDPAVWYKTQGFVQGFTDLMDELTCLAREFADAEISPILGADGLFQAEIYHRGRWTCITVNTLDRPNGPFGPLQVVRTESRCPRPFTTRGPQEGLLPVHRRAQPLGRAGARAGFVNRPSRTAASRCDRFVAIRSRRSRRASLRVQQGHGSDLPCRIASNAVCSSASSRCARTSSIGRP